MPPGALQAVLGIAPRGPAKAARSISATCPAVLRHPSRYSARPAILPPVPLFCADELYTTSDGGPGYINDAEDYLNGILDGIDRDLDKTPTGSPDERELLNARDQANSKLKEVLKVKYPPPTPPNPNAIVCLAAAKAALPAAGAAASAAPAATPTTNIGAVASVAVPIVAGLTKQVVNGAERPR